MRLLADLHISPRTVSHLRRLGYEVVRVSEVLPATASDGDIVAAAIRDDRAVLTQDLDFSALISLSGLTRPSLISLRLASSRIERVNEILEKILPAVEEDAREGVIVTVEDHRVRRRRLPIS